MTTTRTIDVTPTWVEVLPLLIEVAANGDTSEARKVARGQLQVMAELADKYNAARKDLQGLAK